MPRQHRNAGMGSKVEPVYTKPTNAYALVGFVIVQSIISNKVGLKARVH